MAIKKNTKKKISKSVKKTPTKKVAPSKKIKQKKTTAKPTPKKGIKKSTVSSKKSVPKKLIKKVVARKKAIIKKKVVAKAIKKVVAKNSLPKPFKKTAPKKVVRSKKTIKPIIIPKKESKPVKPVVVKEKIKKAPVVVPIVAPTPPKIEVSNWPKLRVKNVLVSQPKPENEKNPYIELAKKHNLRMNFRQFIRIEGLPVKEFRTQRVDILEHRAVILTSRMAVDHYFRICSELRITVPESVKYFCINEATAYYLQKYIQYRKRKIFFGHQTIKDLVDVIKKNKEESFLLPVSDVHKEQIADFLDELNIKYTKAVLYKTVHADLSDIKTLDDYDVLVFFTPAGIKSLKHNFPNFKQGNTRIAAFGAATANTVKELKLRLDIYAPNPKNPSMTGALEDYIKEANKR